MKSYGNQIILQLSFGTGLFAGLCVAHPIFGAGVAVCLGTEVFFIWKLGKESKQDEHAEEKKCAKAEGSH